MLTLKPLSFLDTEKVFYLNKIRNHQDRITSTTTRGTIRVASLKYEKMCGIAISH